jgi:hypothetical protein
MGVLSWMTRSFGRDLDERVSGTGGVAHVVYGPLLDEAELRVKASILRGHTGDIELVVGAISGADERPPPHQERGRGDLLCRLEAGKRYRQAELTITARVESSSEDPLAGLQVEVSAEVSGAVENLQTFSVESRFDGDGHAELKMVVRFA